MSDIEYVKSEFNKIRIKLTSSIEIENLNMKEKRIINLLKKNPYYNIFKDLELNSKSNSAFSNTYNDSIMKFYEEYQVKQIEFLSKFYITISKSEALSYFSSSCLDDIIKKYSIIDKNNYLHFNQATIDSNIDLKSNIENLNFINNNSNLVENNVKASYLIYSSK
jgi:hypothetical protein